MSAEEKKNRELRKAGLKVTVPRLKILHLLEQADPHHVTAEDIYKALLAQGEEIGLATVYRVLTQFEAASLVKRHYFEGGHSVFELEKGDHHDHLVCLRCGHVAEFLDSMIEKRQEAVALARHFKVVSHTHTIYGICSGCQQQNRVKIKC